ncbi:MAG TPA: hypothetical protein VN767_23695 [Streptosporangiaceae bacterium]|jgi:hypothetical protein|nr:hypothetical protein [Streptosporangiaceae bacterium]
MNDVPVACSLDASDLTSRMNRWNALTDQAKPVVTRTNTGLRVAFSKKPGIADELAELAALERDCCAFASWTVRQDLDTVVLDISASSAEGVAVVQDMLFTSSA